VTETDFTLIDEGRLTQVTAVVGGERIRISPAALQTALGWELKPQGICREHRCIPVRPDGDLVTADGIDLAGFASALSRPLAVDVDERAACLGASAAERSAQLVSLVAPDFTLPDLSGRRHSLSDYRGKKVLLVAYASW
jgi:AhpC/TSA family